mmetsp:Transcript_50552/g.64762  ORF Transcript_50552/g.64762 Transcript_50552/m.64762 type:complete len:406 (-) Transcript_50552:57-1274(-)
MGGGNTKHALIHKKVIAADESKYCSAAYWDNRYLSEEGFQFDWFQRYGHSSENLQLRKIIREFIPSKAYTLVIGAGISRMSEEMNADGYLTILNTDVSGTAVRVMTDHYKERYGKWVYHVLPGCSRLYARRSIDFGGATDTALFQELHRRGISTITKWVLSLELNILAPFFRQKEIMSPRDLIILDPDELSNFLGEIDEYMLTIDEKVNDITPSMVIQEALGKLRVTLGYDVERGGGGRVIGSGDPFVVVERRMEGSQTHLKLISGGWVLACHPTTFEPMVKLTKQMPGGYPPPSIILNPHPNANEPFLPALDYRQMNGLALDELEEETFDAVIIKATIDALLCGGEQGRLNALRMTKEAYRVLKPTGKFICISHGGLTHPDLLNRTELFKEVCLDINVFVDIFI